jgi:hypothetical protein
MVPAFLFGSVNWIGAGTGTNIRVEVFQIQQSTTTLAHWVVGRCGGAAGLAFVPRVIETAIVEKTHGACG